MGEFFHDSRFFTFLPKVVQVGCVGLPVAYKPRFGVNPFKEYVGLALVCEVFVDGNDVNLSLCFVEGLDSPIQEDVVARE
jgi:hypothetical protein